MFAKLLKYEWKSQKNILGILTLVALGMGVFATVILRVMLTLGRDTGFMPPQQKMLMSMSMMAMGMMLVLCIVGLFLYMAAVQYLMLFRFYKNKYTDEGYLTFTLPVTSLQIYWSSLLNMLLWMVISTAVVVVMGIVIVLVGTAAEGLINMDIVEGFGEFLKLLGQADWGSVWDALWETEGGAPVLTLVLYGLTFVITPFYGLMIPMCCITVGAVLVKRLKLLAAVGIYYGVNSLISVVSYMTQMIPTMMLTIRGGDDVFSYLNTTLGLNAVLMGGLTVAAYIVTTKLMKNKLNLP